MIQFEATEMNLLHTKSYAALNRGLNEEESAAQSSVAIL